MEKARIKIKELDAPECLTSLQQLSRQYGEFIRDNKDLSADIDRLKKSLEAAALKNADSFILQCRENFRKVLARLEEIAEDQQRLSDESPLLPEGDTVSKSTKNFEIKRSFEKSLSQLL